MAGDDHNISVNRADEDHQKDLTATEKSKWERLWPVIACGAGLFSDGYLNGVIGSVSTMLATIYPKQYAESTAQSNVSSITFAGTLLGNLLFGWTSDHWSRKWSLFVSTIIIIVFAALSTGSYGAGGSVKGLFAALAAWRFFLGIGIGMCKLLLLNEARKVYCYQVASTLRARSPARRVLESSNLEQDIDGLFCSQTFRLTLASSLLLWYR